MTQTTDAALVPEDVRALRVQNGALRTLNRCLEAEIKQHRARAQEYHAASQTLDSEREANRILTDTIEAQARRIEALEGALRKLEEANDKMAAGRSRAAYFAMIDAGQLDTLADLDGARWDARALLSKAPPHDPHPSRPSLYSHGSRGVVDGNRSNKNSR